MKHLLLNFTVITLSAILTIMVFNPAVSETLRRPVIAPEFTHANQEDWINSEPLSLNNLQGNVVLIDFWTFDCWNCYRSFPWLNAMQQRLPNDNFQIIGVHTPEFSHEKVRENIVAKVKEFKLKHPVMIDNDFSYWKAMYNKYWPAFYIIDKKNQVRGIYYGETHEGDPQAKHIEKTIRSLLEE